MFVHCKPKKLAELKQIKVTNCLKFLEVDEFQN